MLEGVGLIEVRGSRHVERGLEIVRVIDPIIGTEQGHRFGIAHPEAGLVFPTVGLEVSEQKGLQGAEKHAHDAPPHAVRCSKTTVALKNH